MAGNYVKIEGILQYLPFYILGILLPIDSVKISFQNSFKIMMVALSVVMILMLLIFLCNLPVDLYVVTLLNVCGLAVIIGITNIMEKAFNNMILKMFEVLSYVSLSAYLLHNSIFGLFNTLCKESNGYIAQFMAPVVLVVLFIVSFSIQKIYDRLVTYCKL